MVKRAKSSHKEDTDDRIEPMLCTLVKEPILSEDYIYELKWDGYRIISRVENGKVRMSSRGGLDYTAKYPLIAEALQQLGHDAVIDGEVVVFGKDGKPDFDTLQLYNGKRTPIRYCVFDLLEVDGTNIMELPLSQRKELLKTLVDGNEIFYYSESYEDGQELYQMSLDHNLEGIVAKDKNSEYIPGSRGNAWLKVPTRKRQEFVIGGWAESDKSRSFKSLLFGAYENGKFTWIGRSGGGYKQHEMPGILKKLQELEIDESPFANKVLDTKGAKTHWVKPKLVANFEFATWTKSGRIRKPATFLGFRLDKDPKDVVREVPKEAEVVEEEIEEQHEQEKEIKIATYNINGINGRLAILLRWLKQAQPDVVCLQELKCESARFPEKAIQDAGYHAIWQGEKSWNGVAILSKAEIKPLRDDLPGDDDSFTHSRYIEGFTFGMVIGCLYLPNGNPYPGPKFDYKQRWFKRLAKHGQALLKTGLPVMLIGDYNVMPTELDTYKPEKYINNALFRTEIRKAYADLVNQGWTDAIRALYPGERIYTFWDYLRNAYERDAGLRLDHFLLNPALAERLLTAGVDKEVRGWEKSSDHAPVWIKIKK